MKAQGLYEMVVIKSHFCANRCRQFIQITTLQYMMNKRPQTAMPALIKVQPTGQSQQIFLNAKNIFKLGAIFRENAQRVQKFI